MKRSEVCGVYERELVVLNGKMMEIFDRQMRVKKKSSWNKEEDWRRKELCEARDVRLKKEVLRYGIR